MERNRASNNFGYASLPQRNCASLFRVMVVVSAMVVVMAAVMMTEAVEVATVAAVVVVSTHERVAFLISFISEALSLMVSIFSHVMLICKISG